METRYQTVGSGLYCRDLIDEEIYASNYFGTTVAEVAAVVVGSGGGAVEASDTGSSDELHAAMIRTMTVNGATNHNCCDQLFRLWLSMVMLPRLLCTLR